VNVDVIDRLAAFGIRKLTELRVARGSLPRPPPPESSAQIALISDGGERVLHLYPNDCYFAHLSIYRFALDLCRGRTVLDAGSGSGYGAAYLAREGALQVTAVEFDDSAVLFRRAHFPMPNLQYHQGDISQIGSTLPHSEFDLIYTSNVVEHIQDVAGFLRGTVLCLKAGGTLVFAVPPIVSQERLDDDLRNPHHINHWSPHQWRDALSRYYRDVVPYRHSYESSGIALDFANTPAQTRVNENEFLFEAVTLEQLYALHTFTVLFVAQDPIDEASREREGEVIGFPLPTFNA
jgi:SAM-dependent methyltransferase